MPRRFTPLLLLPLLLACDAAPLRWEPATPAIDGATEAGPGFVRAVPTVDQPPSDARGASCPGSVRMAMADSGFVAVWWAVRPDSTAWLLSARGARVPDASRRDDATWEPAVLVDTLDRGAHGCARPAPSVAFEPRTSYVHVSYAMDAPEGTGVFFAHSMDAGRMYHSPVPIVYGPRLVATDIVALGDTVAVAYEDPNSTSPPQVALALSVTAGHIFEKKSIPVSGGAHAAVAPLVAIDASGIAVGWRERRPEGTVAMRRRATWAR